MSENYNFLKELREAAAKCPDILIAKIVRDRAHDLSAALTVLRDEKSIEAMKEVNACWSRAAKALAQATTPPTNPPRSGDSSATEFQMKEAA